MIQKTVSINQEREISATNSKCTYGLRNHIFSIKSRGNLDLSCKKSFND